MPVACALALGDIPAGVDDEPVQPGRELGFAAELAEPDAELCERFLGRVSRVLWIRQEVRCKTFHPGSVPLAECRKRLLVAVLCPPHQDRIAQPLVVERPLGPQLSVDLTARAPRGLHSGD